MPFRGSDKDDFLESCKINEVRFFSKKWQGVSETGSFMRKNSLAKGLVRSMLSTDPTKRPSAEELLSNSLFGENEVKPQKAYGPAQKIELPPKMHETPGKPTQGLGKLRTKKIEDDKKKAAAKNCLVIPSEIQMIKAASASVAERTAKKKGITPIAPKYSLQPVDDFSIDDEDPDTTNIRDYINKYSKQEKIFQVNKKR